MKRCVINYSKGSWYPRGQKRLEESFLHYGYDGDFLFDNDKQFGCPTHQAMPYAFKSYLFQLAIERGYEQIIWCDAAICLHNENSLPKIYEQLDKDGYMMALGGFWTGQWCSDAALPLLGITREQAWKIPHIMANCMGFDVRKEKPAEFLRQYHVHAQDGSFKGEWINKDHCVSTDDRVSGHRHDQTAASVIAWRLGMDHYLTHWTDYDPNTKNSDIVLLTYPA